MGVRGPTSSGSGLPASVSQTEARYLDGVTSAIQTQLTARALFPVLKSVQTVPAANVISAALAQLGTVNVSVTTTRVNEIIFVGFTGSFQQTGTTLCSALLGYQIDSDSAVLANKFNSQGTISGPIFDASFVIPVTIAAAGTYVVKLCLGEDAGGTIRTYTTATLPGTFYTVQF